MIRMADEKKFVPAGSLKPGSYVLIDEEVCQVKSTEKSKPGKHGAAKVRIVAFNIFTGQKRGLLKVISGISERNPISIKSYISMHSSLKISVKPTTI